MRLFVALAVPFVFFSACKPDIDVQTIVNQAYMAHGKPVWDQLEALHYEKQSTVFNADGSVRVNTTQRHQYQFKPEFWAIIHWEVGDEAHEILYTDRGAEKRVNEVRTGDELAEKNAYESVNAARYTVSQPFKLNDPGVELSYEGEDELEDGARVHVVKATYNTENEHHSKNDEWWYYFDVNSYLCLATMVHHGKTYSYIRNIEYDRSTGIVFNAHRKGYAVDSARNILYHQSEYFYRNYMVR